MVVTDLSTPTNPGYTSLTVGDSACNVALFGTLDELDAILDEARRQTAGLRARRRGSGP